MYDKLFFNMMTRMDKVRTDLGTKYKVFLKVNVLKWAVRGRQLESDAATPSAGCQCPLQGI